MFKPKKLVEENKLLDDYIAANFDDYDISDTERILIANTVEFQCYKLRVAWNALLAELAKIFPFNLFVEKED